MGLCLAQDSSGEVNMTQEPEVRWPGLAMG